MSRESDEAIAKLLYLFLLVLPFLPIGDIGVILLKQFIPYPETYVQVISFIVFTIIYFKIIQKIYAIYLLFSSTWKIILLHYIHALAIAVILKEFELAGWGSTITLVFLTAVFKYTFMIIMWLVRVILNLIGVGIE